MSASRGFIYALPRNFRGCLRHSSTNARQPPPPPAPSCAPTNSPKSRSDAPEEESALSRRFAAMAEDAILSSPSSKTAQEAVTTAVAAANSLSSDVKQELLDRIASAEFNSRHAAAIATARLPSYASKHTRDLAGAQPWTGEEAQEDAVLRMLTDAHKPLKGQQNRPMPVDLRPRYTFAPKVGRGERVATARERSFDYVATRDSEDKEEFSKLMKERFEPHSRTIASVSALMSLADQRIEDARARGMFADVPKGKPRVEDHNVRSPYLDTTEYLLNKMIQRQEILPPWVEKQQELGRAVAAFRKRLRDDWLRFVARNIAAKGGSLEEQCRRADAYAAAEARRVNLDALNKKIQHGEDVPPDELAAANEGPTEVFRDATWEATEFKYNTLEIKTLNDLCSSYNIMAPAVARKPPFNLQRELDRCFAEVAPLVSQTIRDRAKWPNGPGTVGLKHTRSKPSSLMEKLREKNANYHAAEIRDSQKPNYGFKNFWRDIFGRKAQA